MGASALRLRALTADLQHERTPTSFQRRTESEGLALALFTLRAAEDVLGAKFLSADRDLDPETVAVARGIIERRSGDFDR